MKPISETPTILVITIDCEMRLIALEQLLTINFSTASDRPHLTVKVKIGWHPERAITELKVASKRRAIALLLATVSGGFIGEQKAHRRAVIASFGHGLVLVTNCVFGRDQAWYLVAISPKELRPKRLSFISQVKSYTAHVASRQQLLELQQRLD